MSDKTRIYIQFPEEHRPQVLHPATVENINVEQYTAAAEESFLALETGLEVEVYFHRRRQFYRQPARIQATLHGDRPRFVFEMLAEPTLADLRRCYRVSITLTELTCTFNQREHCPIEDVAVESFSVISPEEIELGRVVDVSLADLKDRRYHGKVEIHSARERAEGFRYGVRVVAPTAGGGDLQHGVSALSLAQQRRELRRLAGTG